MGDLVDDLGYPVAVGPVGRVVSLVPSLTDAVACSARDLLVGATRWCSHPAGLDVVRVGGTKNPDVEAIVALRPDLVLANAEENRAVDLEALRGHAVPVYVTDIRSVSDAVVSLERMLRACGVARPAWLEHASDCWDVPPTVVGRRLRAVVPIWRRPWMALGPDTFAGDVLARLGVDNVLAGSGDRYPRFSPGGVPDVDLVVLPDEPYQFTADDGPEVFAPLRCALVDGRMLTWYGPSLVEAPAVLVGQLRAALQ